MTEDQNTSLVKKFLSIIGKDKVFRFEGTFVPLIVLVDWWKYQNTPKNAFIPVLLAKRKDSNLGYVNESLYQSLAKDNFEAYLKNKWNIKNLKKELKILWKSIDQLYLSQIEEKPKTDNELLKLLEMSNEKLGELAVYTLFIDQLNKQIVEEAVSNKEINVNLDKIWSISQLPHFQTYELRHKKVILEALQKKDLSKLQYIYINYTFTPSREYAKNEACKSNINILKKEISYQETNLKAGKNKFEKAKSNLTKVDQNILDYLSWVSFLRDERKDYISKCQVVISNIAQELFKLWGFDPDLANYALVFDILKGKEFINSKLEIIKKRKESDTIILHLGGDHYQEEFSNIQEEIEFIEKRFMEENVISNTGEIKGQVGSPGIVRGKAKIILNTNYFYKFKQGEILIAPMTRPEYVPLMKKAIAIVTDEGGITSHAAIVARELGIPAVIGTKIATKALHDGDLIEVDANKGVVRIIERKN